MSSVMRDGHFDVAIIAGAGLDYWPSVGVQILSAFCTQMGLQVGVFGGNFMRPCGVLPQASTGGTVVLEDSQRRMHRIFARSVVRFSSRSVYPDPFIGWDCGGLITLSLANELLAHTSILWKPATVILGSGNGALRLGSKLLELGRTSSVACVEANPDWGGKRYAGWEVEKRRFEIAGGRLLEAKPIELQKKGPELWQLKLMDKIGKQIVDVGKVVSAGPFSFENELRQYPPDSMLFEMDQTAPFKKSDDVEGWEIEEATSRLVATKIVKLLVQDLSLHRETYKKALKKAKSQFGGIYTHRSNAHVPLHDGKWMAEADLKKIQNFPGLPQKAHQSRPVAALECLEDIGCKQCEIACPESAIKIDRKIKNHFLSEFSCTGCGICVAACPSQAVSMLHFENAKGTARIYLPWRLKRLPTPGENFTILNRKGESLGVARFSGNLEHSYEQNSVSVLAFEVPIHLAWEARGVRPVKPKNIDAEDASIGSFYADPSQLSEVLIDGEKRLVASGQSVSFSLLQLGEARFSDGLLCSDGSCGRCFLEIDGRKRLGCQTKVHRGMSIKIPKDNAVQGAPNVCAICVCDGIDLAEVKEQFSKTKYRSLGAFLSVNRFGTGTCHGRICLPTLRRLAQSLGIQTSDYIDWRFPSFDWNLVLGDPQTGFKP